MRNNISFCHTVFFFIQWLYFHLKLFSPIFANMLSKTFTADLLYVRQGSFCHFVGKLTLEGFEIHVNFYQNAYLFSPGTLYYSVPV